MAYRLLHADEEEFDGITFNEWLVSRFYDVIGDENVDWSEDIAEVLHARSALELVRDQYPAERMAILDEADAFWRARPKAFNHDFRYQHARKKVGEELEGWVIDDEGHTPRIPLTHWWWWPLEDSE